MKRLFLLSAAVLMVLAGCTKNEVVQTPDQEITFSAPVVGAVTKAVAGKYDANEVYNTGEKFVVFAKYSPDANLASWDDATSTLYMNYVTCKYDGTSSWIPDGNQYYWPKNGALTFAAYSPSDINATATTYGKTGLSITGYTTPAVGAQYDVLYSARAYNKTIQHQDDAPDTPSYTGVDIHFYHALSSIKFKVKQAAAYDGTTLTLNKLTLKGVYEKGDFLENITVESGDNTSVYDGCTRAPMWTNQSSEQNYVIVQSSNQQLSQTATDVTGASDILLIAQNYNHAADQSTEDYIELEVVYSINSPGDDTPAIEQTQTIQFKNLLHKSADGNSNADHNDCWKPGYEYTYTISIGLNEIKFEPVIEAFTGITVTPDMSVNY